MERIQALITKLKEQADQNTDPGRMLVTVQLLQNELAALSGGAKTWGTSKVAVVLPSSMQPGMERYAPQPIEDEAVVIKEELPRAEKKPAKAAQDNSQIDLIFDPLTEIPTLSHQLKGSDSTEPESLNDRLRKGKGTRTELAEMLKETPVKDLRKAIGINDRFVFINDLFRGDEAMYERSIKTINSFAIFPEAEYWISRELKVKLGWDSESPAVAHFDQLVKRRFS